MYIVFVMYVYMYMACMRLGLLVLRAGGSFCSFSMFALLLSCALFLFLYILPYKNTLKQVFKFCVKIT